MNEQKIKVLEGILGAENGWIIQLKLLKDSPAFDIICDAVIQSTLANLELENLKTKENIKKLEEWG